MIFTNLNFNKMSWKGELFGLPFPAITQQLRPGTKISVTHNVRNKCIKFVRIQFINDKNLLRFCFFFFITYCVGVIGSNGSRLFLRTPNFLGEILYSIRFKNSLCAKFFFPHAIFSKRRANKMSSVFCFSNNVT